ncbi:hypothetical protein [Aeribacillus pallidus]|uniref:hypothetical protein n=1 Tax=Aeribacillus pallidus TaxID=33936 RepID=UPI003D1FB7F5
MKRKAATPAGTRSQARPLFERGKRLAACPRKASATSGMYKYQQYRLTDIHANCHWNTDE